MIIMELGQNIRYYRAMAGFTQKQLSSKARISNVALVRYENSERFPTVDIVQRIADALEIPIVFLFDIKEDVVPLPSDEIEKNETDLAKVSEMIETRRKNISEIVKIYDKLNEQGRARILDYVGDISKIPGYRKKRKP